MSICVGTYGAGLRRPDPTHRLSIGFDGTGNVVYDRCGHTLTPGGNITQSTDQKKFLGKSGSSDGVGDSVIVTHNNDLNLANYNFYFYTFFRLWASTNYPPFIDKLGTAPNRAYGIYLVLAGSPANTYTLNMTYTTNGTTDISATSETILITPNTWYCVEVCRVGATLYMFIDGVSKSVTNSNIGTATIYNATSTPLKIFEGNNAALTAKAYFDDLHLYIGNGFYTTTHTPPTRRK